MCEARTCIAKDPFGQSHKETVNPLFHIRCSTSVAANYRAALMAQTKAAFISKISIVVEEADETEFWLEFIMDEKMLQRERVLHLFNEAHELTSIFITTRRTAQKKGT